MPRQLRDDAQAIWQAGVDAVRPARLIPEHLAVDAEVLQIGDCELPLDQLRRIAVVGCGKAGADMALAVEQALGEDILHLKQVGGIVNVPTDCLVETRAIELVGARPAGINEPTAKGVAATSRILDLVGRLGEDDLCLCLISGGGSALLESPVRDLSLDQLVQLTRDLSAAGATIGQLNAVRRELSLVKGGGLARACRAGRLIALILSDVLGDDLATIASGPTVDSPPNGRLAIETLADLGVADTPAGRHAVEVMSRRPTLERSVSGSTRQVVNLVIGNNAAAVDAAGQAAERLGYLPAMTVAAAPEGVAEKVARDLAQMACRMREQSGPDCLISGGEPTVELAPAAERGKGGRNQQLALAALAEIDAWQRLALLSGGTDGEDGPTDAAGAVVDARVSEEARRQKLDPHEYLRRNDAYHFFEQTGGLILTGPTNTNVCDLRVVTVDRS